MVTERNIVIIGATSHIAKYCARLWVQKYTHPNLFLVARNIKKLQALKDDLLVRNSETKFNDIPVDFNNPQDIQIITNSICTDNLIDIILIAHGNLPDQRQCQNDLLQCHAALHINALSPVLFAEAFASHLHKQNSGTIALIGSVAGDRGRKSNYVYGSAKGLITRYAQGLQHRFAKTNVKIVLIKPGPTDSPMTHHLKQQGQSLAKTEVVAQQIVSAIEHGQRCLYTPSKWKIIMMIIRHLPFFIFKRMNI